MNSVFTSRLSLILTMVGMAVGLGNVWRFPYMMGSYGGSAFLLIYLLFTLMLAIPALMAEMHLGRTGKLGTIASFKLAFGTPGKFLGYFLVGVITISASYYGIIVNNVIISTYYSITQGFDANDNSSFAALLSNPNINYLSTLVLIIVSLVVVAKGLNKGIEKVSKLFMPFFLISLIYIIAHTLSLPTAISKLGQFLSPDFTNFGIGESFAALGQAFFSVGCGGTFVVVYAGYMRDEESIPTVATYTGLGDLGASLLISIFLIPAILIFNLEMDSGPSLIFNTLPKLFATMPGGRFVGSLFFLSITFVAFLSLIAAYEVTITSVTNSFRIKKRNVILVYAIVQAILIAPSIIKPELIGTLDLIFGSGMQVFGSLMAVIGVTWMLKERKAFIDSDKASSTFGEFLYRWSKWIIPLILSAILISYIYQSVI